MDVEGYVWKQVSGKWLFGLKWGRRIRRNSRHTLTKNFISLGLITIPITVLTDQTTIPLMFPLVLQPLHGTRSLKINNNLHH